MSVHDLLATICAEREHDAGVLAVFPNGSVTRGDHDEYGDLNLNVLVESDACIHTDKSSRQGRLVSVERSTTAHRARALQRGLPCTADRGFFAELQLGAQTLDWATVQAQARGSLTWPRSSTRSWAA